MKGAYPDSLREEELKNKVASDWFGAFDCTRIIGNIDFCADIPATELALGYEAEPALWAEAKAGTKHDIVASFVQLVITIGKAKTAENHLPPLFLGAFDAEKIAFLPYAAVMDVFTRSDFNWNITPSDHESREFKSLYSEIAGKIKGEKTLFRYAEDASDLKRFIRANFRTGRRDVTRIQINKNTFTHIYRRWRESVLPFIDAPWQLLKKEYGIYDRDFYLAEMNIEDNGTADIVDDRVAQDFYITFDARSTRPYSINRKNEHDLFETISFGFKVGGLDAYAEFWRRYKRPPKKEYWRFIVSRLDLLVPQDVRERKGSFFTPAIWVEKSQQYLAYVLGENWQDEYFVWDCAGGTGNLEAGLTNKYNVFVSTIDQPDVDAIYDRIRNGANLLESHVFRFDFLNDSFDKLPPSLREIIDDPEKRKKLVIYINPPYAEAASATTSSGTGANKDGVATASGTYTRYKDKIGRAINELFAQFLIRAAMEIPGCVIGQFSKLKHLQGPNFKAFRQVFRGRIEKCFVVPADTFDNVKGQFPIGFFVWRLWDESKHRDTKVQRKAIREFLEGEPVARLTGHEFEGIKGRENLIDLIYESLSSVNWVTYNESVGSVNLAKAGIRDSIYHGFGRAKLSAFAALPELIAKGVVVSRNENWKGREYDSYVLASPVMIADEAYCAIIVVNIYKYGEKRYYLHEVGRLSDIKNAARGFCTPGAVAGGIALRIDRSCPRLDYLHPDDGRSIAHSHHSVNGAKKIAEGLRSGSSGETPALSRTRGDIRSIAYSIFADNEAEDCVFRSAVADVYDRKGVFGGKKTLISPDGRRVIMDWIRQFYDKTGERLAYCRYLGSDFQNNNGVFITLAPSANDLKQVKGNWITPTNLSQFAVYFAVRLCMEADWLNDRDQFLCPNDGWKSDEEFQGNCLIYTLFHGQNRVSSRDGVNHWIPFTEAEVDAKDRFASHFMSDFLNLVNPVNPVKKDSASLRPCVKERISSSARDVLDAGRELWRYYHAQPGANPNASYYDIRLHFQGVKKTAAGKEQMNSLSGDPAYTELLAKLRNAHKVLAAKIASKVYEYGFLKK